MAKKTASKKDDGSAATSSTTKTKGPAPKSVLDKIVYAIRSSPVTGSNGGVSRTSIVKYLKSELDYDNPSQIKTAFKRGVTSKKLTQVGQSFLVTGDAPRETTKPPGEPLQIEDVGKKPDTDTEEKAEIGDTVTVKYAGTLEDGTKFDSAPKFEFLLGAGDVIKGWDQGLVGLAVGGRRKLVVPSHLGYGKRGCSPDIPPNAILYFDITMKRIVKGKT